jgi:biopolymer transport protein ExbD
MAVSLPNNPRDEEVDMAPMIDMVFLLLVFFMVSSHLQSEEFIPLEIPKASAAKIPEDRSDRIVVSVDDKGVIYLGASPVEESVLEEVMKKRNDDYLALTGGEQRMKLFLRGHQNTEHGDIKKVMRIAADAGIVDIIFATHEEVD